MCNQIGSLSVRHYRVSTASKLAQHVAYTLCDEGLPDILVVQVQQRAWFAFKGLPTVQWTGTIKCALLFDKKIVVWFILFFILFWELFRVVKHRSSASNIIWCARPKALPYAHARLWRNLIRKTTWYNSQRLITHGLLTVYASKSGKWCIADGLFQITTFLVKAVSLSTYI